jgi:hypothetical protein
MFYFQLMGGIGNQMFQYAAGKSLSIARSIPVRFFFFDAYEFARRSLLLDKFALDIELVDQNEKNRIETLKPDPAGALATPGDASPHWLMTERMDFAYDDQLFHASDNVIMIGYWQNELYFKRYSDEIRRLSELKCPSGKRFQDIGKLIKKKRCPISVHIRRGDYAAHPEILAIHGLCPPQYYYKALQMLQERLSDIHLFLFSDDIAWVKTHFDVQGLPCDIVEPSHSDPQDDLLLMSWCKHHIIANSSFSWWGAWLSPSPDKIVIAPRQWMIAHYDPPIICSNWISI